MSDNILKIDGKTFKFSALTKREKWEGICSQMSNINWGIVDSGVYSALIDDLALTNTRQDLLAGEELEANRRRAEYLTDNLYDVASGALCYPYPVFAVFPNESGEEHFKSYYDTERESEKNFKIMARKLAKISKMESYSHMEAVLDTAGLSEFETSALNYLMTDIEFWKPPFSHSQQSVYLSWQIDLLALAFPKYGIAAIRGMYPTPEGPVGYLMRSYGKNKYEVLPFSVYEREDLTMLERIQHFTNFYISAKTENKNG